MVKKLKKIGLTAGDDAFIDLTGSIIFKDASKGAIEMRLYADRAIENSTGNGPELIIPETCRNNRNLTLYNELKKLLCLYRDGKLDREQFESQKQKLLEQ